MNRLLKCVCIIFLSIIFGSVKYAAAFEQMKSYTVADGLVGPIVPIIFQDSRGVLWFGSDRGGVSRYDGNAFIPYPGNTELFRGRTKTIVEDKWGHIWFLSKHPAEGSGVISRYDGTTFEYITDGNCIAADNTGDIWVGSDNTITRFTSENLQDQPEAYPYNIGGTSIAIVNVIYQSKDDTFWIGGQDAQGVLIMKFQTDVNIWQISNLERLENIPNLSKQRSVEVITQDRDDMLWFGGKSLLLSYDGNQFVDILNISTETPGTSSTYQSTTATLNGNVSIKSDVYGRMWFSDNNQLRWWNGSRLRPLKKDALILSQSTNLQGSFEIEDAWNKLWFATETGAYVYDTKSRYFDEEIPILPTEDTQTDTTNLEMKVYRVDDGLGSDNILTIFESLDGKIWFGHDNGVTSYEPQPVIVNHTTRTIMGSNSVRMMESDSTGNLWLSIPGGVAQYLVNDDKLNQYNLTNIVVTTEMLNDVNNNENDPNLQRRPEITDIFEADGYIWFLDKPIRAKEPFTLYRIYCFRDEAFQTISIHVSADIGPGGDPEYNDSVPIVTSGKNTWIVVGGWVFLPRSNGLHRLSPDGRIRKTYLNTIESLPSPSAAVTALHTDEADRLWCYYDTGEVKRFSNIRITTDYVGGNVHTEVMPLQSVIPVGEDSEDKVVQWFYNTVSGQLMYWENPDVRNTLTELPGAASGAPLRTFQTSSSNQNDTPYITFAFHDSIKTYQGVELKNVVSVKIDKINGAIISSDGDLWLATSQGAFRYNGQEVTTYSIADGFLVDDLRDVHEDRWGNLWFATWGGGVVRYDGNSFQPLTTKDGLVHNNVSSIDITNEKDMWFGTEGGSTQYRADLGALPFCRIVSVHAGKTYNESSMVETGARTFMEIPELLSARVKDITINYQGINPLRDDVEYKFRLLGIDKNEPFTTVSDLKQININPVKGTSSSEPYPTEEVGASRSLPKIRFEGLKSGKYTFLIMAFRKGWPYTQNPAVLNFTIDKPIWSRWRNYLPTLIFVAAVGSLVFRLIVNRRQTAQLQLEMREKEEAELQRIRDELNEAQNIQMGLLPTEAPHTKEFDISGMSQPATQVGGDFFDYVTVANGQTAIAVADAAGKGIRGAMNAVLTNGMLHEVTRYKSEADVILSDLNAGLAPRLYGPSFIALNLAVLDESEKRVDYANGGQPYPILKRGDEIIEIESSDLPLGGMKNVQYESTTFDLNEGDILIFHSDGLIEALNPQQDMYGTERLCELVSNIPSECTAEEVIQHIFDDVQEFVEDAEQYDDMTIVVVKRTADNN